MTTNVTLDRRSLLTAAAALTVLPLGMMAARAAQTMPSVAAQTSWTPPPPQVPVQEGFVDIGNARLWYWDTGGKGEVIVLQHPATGSGLIWGYQQPVFAAAGYRVIGYSRRGFYRSTPVVEAESSNAPTDLRALLDFLKVDRFHLVGSALGAGVVADYLLSYPERVYSFVFASSFVGVRDPEFLKMNQDLHPKGFGEMPADFRELGPSYRAAYRPGVEQWNELEKIARLSPFQRNLNQITWQGLSEIKVPGLMLTGDADLAAPPSMVREFGRHMPGLELVSVAEAGHSVYWEQPLAFNKIVLDFIGKHRRGRA